MVHSHLSRNCEDAAGGSGGVGGCKFHPHRLKLLQFFSFVYLSVGHREHLLELRSESQLRSSPLAPCCGPLYFSLRGGTGDSLGGFF